MKCNSAEGLRTMDMATISDTKVRHAAILPSFAVAFIKQPLNSPVGAVNAEELLSWKREPVSQDLRARLVAQFVHSRRNSFEAIWNSKCNIQVPFNWGDAYTAFEKTRFKSLMLSSPESFQNLTLREIKNETHMSVSLVLLALAKLEALTWVDRPYVPAELGDERRVIPADPDFVAAVREVLDAQWVKDLQSNDLRFATPHGTSFRSWMESGIGGSVLLPEMHSLAHALIAAHSATWAEELESVAEHLVKRITGHRKFEPAGLARRAQIFTTRYGGISGLQLENTGEQFGLTRERVRQICSRMLGGLADRSLKLPALERVLASLGRAAPIPVNEANHQLINQLGEGAGVEAVLDFAAEIGHSTSVRVELSKARTLEGLKVFPLVVKGSEAPPWVESALAMARRDCLSVGCTNVSRIAGLLTLEDIVCPDFQSILSVFEYTPGFRLIDEESKWFTLADNETSAAATRMKKIMAVCNGVTDLDTVASAFVTDTSWFVRNSTPGLCVPPLHVLSLLFSGWDWLDSNKHNIYKAKKAIDPTAVLSRTELAAIQFIDSNGGAVSPGTLVKALVGELNVSSMAIVSLFANSPILVRLEPAVYGIRGRPIPCEAILAVRNDRRRGGGGEEAENGQIMMTQTGSTVAKRVLYLPSYLDGKYLGVFTHAGGIHRWIRINRANQVYYVAEVVEAIGVRPGEKFVMRLDAESSTYEISKVEPEFAPSAGSDKG